MEGQKYLTLTEAKITSMQHSFLCEDVRQALKQCKPPTDFHLVEAHLSSDQKPCAPKYTWADLSLLPEMLAPQCSAPAELSNIENGGPLREKKEPKRQTVPEPQLRVDSSGEMQDSQFGGSSVSGSSVGTHDLPGMVSLPGEVGSQPARRYKENVLEHQQRVRPQTPDVPAFLKKFIQQKRDQQKRGLRESNRDLSSSISLALSNRRAGRSALPRPAKSSEEEGTDRSSRQQDWRASREQGTPSCLPQSPFKMKSLSKTRRRRDGEGLDSSHPMSLHNDRVDNNGCFGPHGPRLKKKVIPAPSPVPSPPRSSGSTRPLADKWPSKSSRKKKFNRDNTSDGNGHFSISRESLVAGLAGLRRVEDGNLHAKRATRKPGTEGRGGPEDLSCGPSLLDFRQSLCNEIQKGVQLRKIATVPPVSGGRDLRSEQEVRLGGGLSDELKKRVLTLRASMKQCSESSDDDQGWD